MDDFYPILKEIQSRLLVAQTVKGEVDHFKKRPYTQEKILTDKERELESSRSELETVQNNSKNSEKKLNEISSQIQKLEIDMFNLKNPNEAQKAETQLRDLKSKKSELEALVISYWETSEELNANIQKLHNFIPGIKSSILEMQEELKELTASKEQELKTNTQLLENTLEQLPLPFKNNL